MEASADPLTGLAKGPILVVEDDHDVRVTLRSVLENAGYMVFTAANGKRAMDILTASQPLRPRLIIVDLMMPILDGWSFIARIAKQPFVQPPILIVVSAFTNQGLPEGISGHLVKPFSTKELMELVQQHCP